MYQVLLAEKREPKVQDGPEKVADSQIAVDVRRGLAADQKFIPSKYFYDARGSRLFEKICLLPEYYLTRTELSVLRRDAGELIDGFDRGDLVELGSGSNLKIRALLDAMGWSRRATTRYVPVDISEAALQSAAQGLMRRYPELKVAAVRADFTRDLSNIRSDRRKLLLFFGSTIGNLNEDECRIFLTAVAENLKPGDIFLLGLDMLKPEPILEAAYNDAQRITAAFNKNILLVLNRELDATFDMNDFEHVAYFVQHLERVEMHLRANRGLTAHIRDLGLSVTLAKGETIRTEICRKFSRATAEKMVDEAGMIIAGWHSDPKGWFSIAEISRRG
ncbi:MAG: L-histidine N(alpha)-methyltransferase [Desulfomonilaceae bacterium]